MKSAPKPAGHQAQVMTKKAVDVGHWMTAISGSCMVLVIFACGIGAFVPWWTVVVIGDDGGRASTGASLWVTVTTTQQQFKETRHVGCPDACDRTRVVQNKVRVSDQKWDDICRHSTGHLRVSCNIVWALRAGVGTALLVGFLYSTPAILSFSGTHQRSVCRFPPIVGVAMTAICVVVLATTIVLALALAQLVVVRSRQNDIGLRGRAGPEGGGAARRSTRRESSRSEHPGVCAFEIANLAPWFANASLGMT
eukprot:TRINITY_DN14622_c0_g1_i2.p1 TRINITY_DN14622_c0_g1~~TRINITY_DN14622_c0_g1_i2.p1  ORF type:complete len:252 (+),score=22.41 TRINITY_DN14622_c0_g1_i2:76-831(+)